jgi:coenzyme F420-0:L-glutamate ligase/coenzyme F420-1:gamma-L-glutamate ligase
MRFMDKKRKGAEYKITMVAVLDIPLIKAGDELGEIIFGAMTRNKMEIRDGDVLVISSKIVSKAEGRLVSLKSITPSETAKRIAKKSGKDLRVVELIMREGEIINVEKGIIETVHRLGFICTSSGIDRANTSIPEEEIVSLLPVDPDSSAGRIRDKIKDLTGKEVGVVINDSLGVRYRAGSFGLAIGVSGMPALLTGDAREVDIYGKSRNVRIAFADEIAAAGSMLMGQSDAGLPVVLISGLRYERKDGKISDLLESDRIRKDIGKLKRELNL